jgi:hypothetical protein
MLSLGQNDYKRFGVHAFYVHMAGVRSDGGFRGEDTSGAANPQSSYSEQGVSSRVNWQTSGLFGLMGNVKLPLKAELSTELFASSGRHTTSRQARMSRGILGLCPAPCISTRT